MTRPQMKPHVLQFLLTLAVLAACTVASAGAETALVKGTVLEAIDVADYTYLHIDSGGAKNWVAAPKTTVSPGDTVSYSKDTVMTDFYSKTLDRTFAVITFSSGLATPPPADTAAPQNAPADDSFAAAVAREQQQTAPTPAVMAETSGGSTGAVAPFAEIQVAKAEGENSYTVEELFSTAKDLDGQTVRVRGKVVKYNPRIMGRNWLHVQDGTGNPMINSHDLVVTTTEEANVGEVIMVEGKLAADKDFGAGYSYAVLVEEARIIK